MATESPTRAAILDAYAVVERAGLPITLQNVRANIQTGSLTIDAISEAAQKHLNSQVPVVLKQEGLIITDEDTRERERYETANTHAQEAQLAIMERSAEFSAARVAAKRAEVQFLRAKEAEFGYEAYPGLFHVEIDRIYAMHSLPSPFAGSSNGKQVEA